MPERELRVAPWEEVAIDLIGPWTIKVHGKNVEFNALTCIDTASNLAELTRIYNIRRQLTIEISLINLGYQDIHVQ